MAALLKLTDLNWRELLRAIWRGSVETNVTNRAAELAFWFLLGFFPMLLSVTGMVSMIGSPPSGEKHSLLAQSGCRKKGELPRMYYPYILVGGSPMETIGAKLHAVRQEWGLTLREVEDRSVRLAEEWGNPSYRISASWLARVERDDRDLSAAKLIVLAVIFSIPAEQLLALCPAGNRSPPQYDQVSSPNTTLLLTNGLLAEQARSWLPDDIISQPIPDKTTLLPSEAYLPSHYRRGVLGQEANPLAPMIRAGSFFFINTQKRAIAHRREWTNEFDRPIYFLFTHAGYICGWCDLDKEAEWLTLVPHALSFACGMRWKYRREVEVIGRVAGVLQRLEESSPMSRA